MDGSAHPDVRKLIVDWICANWDAFSGEILIAYDKSDPDSYRSYMMKPSTEGSVLELEAYTRMTKDFSFRLFFLNGRTTLIGGFQHKPVYNLMFQQLPGGGNHYSVTHELAGQRRSYLYGRISELAIFQQVVEPFVK